MTVDRTALIGRPLRAATYTVSEVDVNDFLSVVAEPDFALTDGSEAGAEAASGRSAPPSFVGRRRRRAGGPSARETAGGVKGVIILPKV